MAERYKNLNTKQVMEYLGVESRQTVWQYVKEGKLPRPRYLSPHRPVWRLGEVVDQLEKSLKPFEIGARGLRGEPGQVELGGSIRISGSQCRERPSGTTLIALPPEIPRNPRSAPYVQVLDNVFSSMRGIRTCI